MDRRDVLKLLGGLTLSRMGLGGAQDSQESRPRPVTRRIGRTSEELPVIGLGTWQTFDVGASREERAPLEQVLRAFVELGGSVVDSSPMYGKSEAVVGDLVARAGLRPKLFLATKVWTYKKAGGIPQMQESMRRLKTDVIDLMQVHNLVNVDTHLPILREWKQAGRLRHVGVTHYTASGQDEIMRLLASQSVDFVQINYSVSEREAEARLLPFALERGIAVIANRPFAGGDLLRRLQAKPLPAWAAEIDCTSWAQLLLKFVVSHPAITCAIPATSKVSHLRDNMKAGAGRMPDETMRGRIASAIKK
jgi:diketogulonate reductase-like aldo/keto reductase